MNDKNENNEILQEEIEDSESSSSVSEFKDERSEYLDEKKEDHRFKEGDLLKFVNVRFPGNARSFPFLLGNKTFYYGQKVVALSDRGMAVGHINSFPYTRPFTKDMLPLFSISKTATEEDLQKEKEHTAQEKKAEKICNELISRHALDMNLTHVEFMQYGKKAVFFFTAPNRVDFRNLVKDLVTELKRRIELRQISIRDRAASLGSTGPCGLQTCCSSFLKNYGNVTIKMAKNQSLALLPNKINGVCSQIKCCIKYEHELYSEKRKRLPKENAIIQTKNADKGKVLTLHLLKEEFEMLTSEGKIRRYSAEQFCEGGKILDDWKMPEQFDNIINETKELISTKIQDLETQNQEATNELPKESAHENKIAPPPPTHPQQERPRPQERQGPPPSGQDNRPRNHHWNKNRNNGKKNGPR